MEAQGDKRPGIQAMARNQRNALRAQAFDDQVFAALLGRYGGDEPTAALYWRLSRNLWAISRGPARVRSVAEVLDYLTDEDELEHLDESLDDD